MLGPNFAGVQVFNQAGSVGKGLVHGSKTDISLALSRVVTVVGIKISFSIAEDSVLLEIGLAGEVGQFTEKRKDVDCVNNNIHNTILIAIEQKGMKNLSWVFVKRESK